MITIIILKSKIFVPHLLIYAILLLAYLSFTVLPSWRLYLVTNNKKIVLPLLLSVPVMVCSRVPCTY